MAVSPNPYRGRNQRPEIHELTIPAWFGEGWAATKPKPHLFRMLVRSLPLTGFKQELYEVDAVDYVSDEPVLSMMIPQFVKSLSKLREALRLSLANYLCVPLEEVKVLRKGSLWCDKIRE